MPITTSSVGSTDPAVGGWAVTPGTAFPNGRKARALFVGGAGNISLVTLGGGTLVFTGVVAGSILPVGCSAVNGAGAGTTATNIVALA